MKARHYFLSLSLILVAYIALNGITTQHNVSSAEFQQPTPTLTPSPAVHTPLPASVIATCPVSLPNLSESPDEHYISAADGYGNPERTLFIGLWPGGKVIFHPNGPGTASTDGTLGMKFWFYRTIPGEVVFEGKRLKEPEPAVHLATLRGPADGYGETGFHPAGLVFPGQGCWEVTARIGDAQMTFITLVVWIPFEPFWARWLPDGGMPGDPDLADYPQTIQYRFQYPDGGELVIGTTQATWTDSPPHPETAQQTLTLREQVLTCVTGGWLNNTWDSAIDASTLIWSDSTLSYRVRQTGLGLTCHDLAAVALGPEQE